MHTAYHQPDKSTPHSGSQYPSRLVSFLYLDMCAVNQKVRVHNIGIKGPSDGSGPKLVKLFINRHSFGFSDADSVPCAQQLDLSSKDLEQGEPTPLKLTKVGGVAGCHVRTYGSCVFCCCG